MNQTDGLKNDEREAAEVKHRNRRQKLDADSDDEATNKMQAVMNCVYLGMFIVIGGIFIWQFYLAEHNPYDGTRDTEDL